MTTTPEARPPLERAIDDYLDGYVLEGDDRYHLPTEHEKLIVKDAIMGLLEEPEFRAALAQRQQVPADALRDALQRILDWDAAGLALTDDHIAAARAALTAAPSAQAEPQVPLIPMSEQQVNELIRQLGFAQLSPTEVIRAYEAARGIGRQEGTTP